MQKPVMDLLESLQYAQSASEKAIRRNEEEEEKKLPCLG